MKTRSRMLLRAGATVLTVVAVMAAVLFFSEPTRAFADSVIRQVGGFIFVQGTPVPDPKKQAMLNEQPVDKLAGMATKEAGVPGLKSGIPEDTRTGLAPDAATASQLVGFTVLAPGYIPVGYAPSQAKNPGGNWIIEPAQKGKIAIMAYENVPAKSFLSIQEFKYDGEAPRQSLNRPEIVDVTVRGHPGVWMPVQDAKNALVWEENGVTFTLSSNTLPLDELKKVAESLK